MWAGAIPFLGLAMLIGQLHCAWAEPADLGRRSLGPACDRAAFQVIVDVGHTAEAPGARSARGLTEYEFNLRLAKQVDERLHEAGFAGTVLLVTEGPARKGLHHRVAQANKALADLFLSIHHDSVPNSFLVKWEHDGAERYYSDRFKGHSLFVSNENADFSGSLVFAKLLGKQLKARGLQYTPHYTDKIMGNRRRVLVDADTGVYRYDQLIVLQATQMPAVLLEAGSIINRDEELLMGSAAHQSSIVESVTDAVTHFCALRQPRNPGQIARRPVTTPVSAPSLLPAAATQSVPPPSSGQ